MADHTQEFIKVLKAELKKEKASQDPHTAHILSRHRLPPAMVLSRLAHINRRFGAEDTWINMARIVYEQWEAETYPVETIP